MTPLNSEERRSEVLAMDSLEERAEKAEEAEDLQMALALWEELATKNQDPAFFVRYGRVAEKLKRWEEAENAFTKALRLNPTSSLIMENIGSLWANRTDKDESDSFQTAKDWFLQALKHERHARLLTQLGATYLALDDNAAARDTFDEAIKIDPDYEEALYNLAVLDEKTNPQKAVELLEKAIQIDPDYAIAHQVLGRLAQRAKDLPRAEYHFRRSLEIDPADYWTNMFLANLLGVLGRNAEAEQAYRFATSLHPEIAGGIETFARFLESIGKDDEATKVRAQVKPSV
jgi:Tfp pilus assembly protein PilF